MSHPKHIKIEDFDYHLPDERIAKYPRAVRDQAKLLYYHKGEISKTQFFKLPELLEKGDLLVVNETKVIPARIHFNKSTGALIEIFCLNPSDMDHQEAMEQRSTSTWDVLIGGAKKWKSGSLEKELTINDEQVVLIASRINSDGSFKVQFSWNGNFSFSEILQEAGELPLPPYFERDAEENDIEKYQTVFAKNEGSVAAPTAALHFTENVFSDLKNKGVDVLHLTLHVGSGTFKPVSSETIEGHEMHAEYFEIPISILNHISDQKGRVIPVGTTSMRSLESAYWLGVKLIEEGSFSQQIHLGQWDAYSLPQNISLEASFKALMHWCQGNGKTRFIASTSMMMAPGYIPKVAKGIITNFHMPKSTLILLVASLIGVDWRKVYEYAKDNEFDFLSYGDSSLLIP
ncbi:MAG: S-adenosylmethionine:tRNA ribosyltransferase-isomerase [Flavobacteriales bacterium]